MREPLPTVTPPTVRRLAVVKQGLSGTPPVGDREGLLQLIRRLGCLQLDPTRAVAPTHLLVPWSRLGAYDPAVLEDLRWGSRELFDYWAHAASIVLVEDYPIHSLRMRTYPPGDSAFARQVRSFLETNRELRRFVLSELRKRGPLPRREIEDRSALGWRSSGWTNERNVDRMLSFLWVKGRVMVAGRRGQERLWDLAERFLPEWTPRRRLAERTVVRLSAERSLRALGVARARDIQNHFTRGRYPGLPEILSALEGRGRIVPVRVAASDGAWPGRWFVHAEDLPLLEALESDDGWEPRTTLLSPFDNLISDRDRTEIVFGFRFRLEIYVPKGKRQFGFYVMPILHEDRLIGRVDPVVDRKRERLLLNAVHAEPAAPTSSRVVRGIGSAIQDLATFVGAKDVEFVGPVPDRWRGLPAVTT